MLHLGIDLGGSKIELIALADGAEVLRQRIDTPRGDYPATIAAIASLVREAETTLAARGTVGIGTPGAISRATGRMKNCNSTWLNGQPLKQDLEAALHRPVRMANDANCFALSEATDGAAAGAETVFGVILGTGCGGGLVVRGQVLIGANAIAGEWGHNPLPWPTDEERPGPPCYCGRTGCIETWLSGPALCRDLAAQGGPKLDARTIVARAAQGDASCEAALARYEERLARGLAHVINLFDPEVIVLGGGLSNLARLYERVPRLWAPYVFSDRVDTRLVPPRFGDSSGVRGAAWLWRAATPTETLRALTWPEHVALECRPRIARLKSETVRMQDYRAFLERLYGFHATLEAHLGPLGGLAPFAPDELHQAEVIAADLHAMGLSRADIAALPRPTVLPPHADADARAGLAYVLAGSALGGLTLAAHLERYLPHPPCRFLRRDGKDTHARWQAVRVALDRHLGHNAAALERAAHAARAALALLADWLDRA